MKKKIKETQNDKIWFNEGKRHVELFDFIKSMEAWE